MSVSQLGFKVWGPALLVATWMGCGPSTVNQADGNASGADAASVDSAGSDLPDAAPPATGCVSAVTLIYTVEQLGEVRSFNPVTATYQHVTTLNCEPNQDLKSLA